MGDSENRICDHPTVRFGDGNHPLVIVPGLSDALQGDETPRLVRMLLERYYMRALADDFDVYIVSRPRGLIDGVTTRDLADGYASVLAEIGPEDVLGMSMGGLIAQYLAIDHPENVRNLVVALAGPHLSASGREIVTEWRDAALDGRWGEVHLGTVDATYSSAGKRTAYGALLKLPGVIKEPPYPDDFINSAQACLDHDFGDELAEIDSRTLVLGGEHDVLFDVSDIRWMVETIPNADARILEDTGHGAFEERRRAFSDAITSFLLDSDSE